MGTAGKMRSRPSRREGLGMRGGHLRNPAEDATMGLRSGPRLNMLLLQFKFRLRRKADIGKSQGCGKERGFPENISK